MLILNGALGSYLANRDVQSVWEVDYRLALTRRMAKMAHKSNLNPATSATFWLRVDDILATFNKNFNQLTELDAKLTQVQRTTPDNITEIKELAKQRQALQNLFQIAVIKVSHNVESARDAIKVQQESIDTRIQNSFRTTMVVAVPTVAAAIVIALVVALLFVRLITKPVGVLEQIVRRSPSIAFRFSAAPGRPVEYVSENVIEFGYSADDFYSGRVKLVDVLHPEDREIVARKLHYLTTAKSSDREFNQEYRIITSSGATCWLDERMWVVLNDKGDITHYEGIVIDITKRKLAEEQLEREQARRVFVLETFGSYLSDEIVAEILESPGGINLGGELREISILVSDLRGFTRITESMDSRKVLKILNRYLEVMTDIILRYSGTIDEFTGDGILVFFGAPRQFSDHSRRAVLCAIEMQKAMKALNEDNIKLGLPELSMGIGINCGELVVGNIGSNRRKKYGAVGTPINVAFRVQTQTIGGDILVTAPVYERVSSNVVIGPVREAVLKGIEGLVTIYQVIGVGKN